MERGVLHVVGTPIGNLDDLTPRAAEVLRQVKLVAAEDTRRTGLLLRHVGSTARMVSLHKFSERAKSDSVLKALASGQDVALVSDAGTPGVSDPGAILVRKVLEQGFEVRPVPGVSAVTAALSVSGLPADSFLFLGFLPSKREQRRKTLEEVGRLPYTLVVYEAPHRIGALLEDVADILGERRCLLARELTKLHETLIYGTASKIAQHLGEPRGEISLVIEGASAEGGRTEGAKAVQRLVPLLVKRAGMSPRECSELLAGIGLGKRKEIYNAALAVGRGCEE